MDFYKSTQVTVPAGAGDPRARVTVGTQGTTLSLSSGCKRGYTSFAGRKYQAWGMWLPSVGDTAKGEPLAGAWGSPGLGTAPLPHTTPWGGSGALDPRENRGSEKEGAGRVGPGGSRPERSPCPSWHPPPLLILQKPRARPVPRMPRFPLAAPSCPQAAPGPPPTPVALGRLRGSRAPPAASLENGMLTGARLGDGLGPCPRGCAHLPKGALTHTQWLCWAHGVVDTGTYTEASTQPAGNPLWTLFLPWPNKVSHGPHLQGR